MKSPKRIFHVDDLPTHYKAKITELTNVSMDYASRGSQRPADSAVIEHQFHQIRYELERMIWEGIK